MRVQSRSHKKEPSTVLDLDTDVLSSQHGVVVTCKEPHSEVIALRSISRKFERHVYALLHDVRTHWAGAAEETETKAQVVQEADLDPTQTISTELYRLCEEGSIRGAVLHLYRFVNRKLNQGEFQVCSQLLENIELERLSPEILVGLLRITYPAKKRVQAWDAAYLRIQQELEQRKLDPAVLLAGLSGS